MTPEIAVRKMLVGVISDTHGFMRPQALDVLRGSDLILHAGDVGSSAVLESLRSIAPVVVVRGNVDTENWASTLPETTVVEIGKFSVYMLHNVRHLDLKPESAGFAAVIFGHSHQPVIEIRNGVLYFNPGSAGPRRFKLPISVGRLTLADGRLEPELITLAI
jgi:putative phosphoesterase